ncbi:hypothetical protein AB894_08180 [Piscirickettsia salmonis]|nr:hypothetical protein AB894_08180 [Piscirickettsia salmonis]
MTILCLVSYIAVNCCVIFFGCDLDQAEQSEQWLLELFRLYKFASLVEVYDRVFLLLALKVSFGTIGG